MRVLSWYREEDVPECSGQEISGSQEMPFGNEDLYVLVCQKKKLKKIWNKNVAAFVGYSVTKIEN